jgi:hypothetical protein
VASSRTLLSDPIYWREYWDGGSEQLIGSVWPRKGRFPCSTYILSPEDRMNRFLVMLLHVWQTKHHHFLENHDFNILYYENLKLITWCYFVSHFMKFICNSAGNVADWVLDLQTLIC